MIIIYLKIIPRLINIFTSLFYNPFVKLVFGICFFTTLTFAQDMILSGRVFDASSKKPLSGVNVFLSHSNLGGSTDASGYFHIRISKTSINDSLKIQHIGYKVYTIPLKGYQNNSIFYLRPQQMQLTQEIVVTSERSDLLHQDIPHAKNIIKAEEIEQSGSSELSDLLKPIASVRIEGNDLDGRKIQIRGSNPDEVNVYLDGVLINVLSFDNAADLSIIPVENIERLEVVRGGGMALLGNGAFGGVVNITSRQNLQKSFSIKTKFGSFKTRYFTGSISLPFTKKLIVGYFFQYNQFQPEIEYFPGERYSVKSKNNHIKTSKQNHHFSLNYFLDEARITGKFITYSFAYKKPKWEGNYNNYLITTEFSGKFIPIGDVQLQISEHYADNTILRIPTGSNQYISTYVSNRLNVRLAKKIAVKDGHIQFLTEYIHSDLLTDTKVKDINWEQNLYHAFIYDNRLTTAGVFSYKDQLKELSNTSWETFIGLRGDFPASGHGTFTNMIGGQINYTMEKWQFSPYLNYGKNVKFPSLTQQAYTRDLADLKREDSLSLKLEPEYSRSMEGGLTAKFFPSNAIYHNLEYSIALFSRSVYNSIIQRPFDDLIAQVQQGRTNILGVETSLKFNNIFKYFYTGLSFIFLDIDNPLLYAFKPKTNSSIHTGFSLPLGFYLSSTYFYEGESIAWYYDSKNDIKTIKVKPFYDLDVSFGYKLRFFNSLDLDAQISGNNVFDNSGFIYYYLKKRFFQASLTLRY